MAHLDKQAPRLIGRGPELGALEIFVRASSDDGSALLLTGEPGVGKSALLHAATQMAAVDGTRVISAGGVEYESDVSFAGLHQLVDPLADDLRLLPRSKRAALEVGLGIGSGAAPGHLAVFDASLALIRQAAARAPLLMVIDDMHWLDRATASVIGSVGRRLGGSPAGLLAAARPGAGGFFERTGWAELVVPPLVDADAMELLGHQFAHLPTRVLRKVAHEAQGNPLALLEFAAAVRTPLDGGRWQAAAASGPSREVRTLYEARIEALPVATRLLLLLAALDGSGSLAVLAAAGGPRALDDLAPAERDHLVVVDDSTGEMAFRHPLIKSVVVERSTLADRRLAHRRLADVFADQPEKRGHHVAQAAVAPNEDVALAVEAGARRTLQRGDVVGAVTTLVRAADLSPDRAARSRRLADAAFLGAFSAGQLANAFHLLRDARRSDPTVGETLQAAVATSYLLLAGDGDVEMAHQLVTVAIESALDEPEGNDFSPALYTLAAVCQFSGRPDYWAALRDVVARLPRTATTDAVLLAETQGDPLTASPSAISELDRVIGRLGETRDVGMIIRTAVAGFNVDRLSGCRDALDRVVRDGREGGAVGSAIMALSMIAFDDLSAGRWDASQRAALEATELCVDLGYRLYEWSGRYALVLLAANRGDRDTCVAGCRAMLEWAAPRRLGRLAHWAHHALAEAALGDGDFETAYAHATAISAPGTLGTHNLQALWTALDLVEAAVRTGRRDEARAHATALREADLGRLSPRFALCTAAAQAMVATDAEALRCFDEALALPGIEAWPLELARVRLTYGQHLRRTGRTRAARTQLRAARDGFDRLGAAPWSRQASAELRATGATRSVRHAGGTGALTPQQLEVAELAAGGLTNREIAARLFVSPRTVSAHLYRAFPKLGVTTRAGLRDALSGLPSDGVG